MRQANRRRWWLGCALVAGLALPLGGHAEATPDDLRAIAEEAYVYAYPLMVMDATARTATNVRGTEGRRMRR